MDDKNAALQGELLLAQIKSEGARFQAHMADLEFREEATRTDKAQRKAIEESEVTRKMEFEMRAKELENSKVWQSAARTGSLLNAAAILTQAGWTDSKAAVDKAIHMESMIRDLIESGS